MKLQHLGLCIALIPACGTKPKSDERSNQSHKESEGVPGESKQQPEGTITSSGGYLYGYENNPWFLQNTAEVKYCIDMDEGNFGVPRATAKQAIDSSIALWKSELQKAKYSKYGQEALKPWDQLRLGTQTFLEVGCDAGDVNLRFQLGNLSTEQLSRVGNPRRYVAGAFETSYDERNMRGSGFIYVGPESGPLRPDAKDAHPHFWSVANAGALKYVLVHELGHVFGFQHSTSDFLMLEDGPQSIIHRDLLARIVQNDPAAFDVMIPRLLADMFGPSNRAQVRIEGPYLEKELFGPNPAASYVFERDFSNTESAAFVFSMYESAWDADGARMVKGQKVGEMRSDSSGYHTYYSGEHSVKFPDDQSIFSISDDLRQNNGWGVLRLQTVGRTSWVASGVYNSLDGTIHVPMKVKSVLGESDLLTIEAVIRGGIVSIADY